MSTKWKEISTENEILDLFCAASAAGMFTIH